MPVKYTKEYTPPVFLRNPHLQTIYPALFRRVKGVKYTRQRLELPDGDFIDLDWSRIGSRKVGVVLHGLEGSSEGEYMKGMIRALNKNGWDAVAMNQRGCSGEPNRLLRSYHSGATEDLNEVLANIIHEHEPDDLAIVGFSLGGNITLKYMGERGGVLSPIISKAVAISVPCDLSAGAVQLAKMKNKIYLNRFLKRLKSKLNSKHHLLPDEMKLKNLKELKDFKSFDDFFTAPVHGFKDAEDYWAQCSSRFFIEGIKRPTLIINAEDDPFLTPECFPVKAAEENKYVELLISRYGGHTGFVKFGNDGEYWHEKKVIKFLE